MIGCVWCGTHKKSLLSLLLLIFMCLLLRIYYIDKLINDETVNEATEDEMHDGNDQGVDSIFSHKFFM